MKKTILMVSLALISWGAYAQHDHDDKKETAQKMTPMFKDKDLGTAYGHYIHLKEALVASQSGEAKNAAVALQKSLASVDNGKTAQAEAEKVAAAASLDEQRQAFTALSNEMITLIKDGQFSRGEVYLEYCPMANGNTGGYWLSNEMEIKNPYLGDKMLKCGSVKETIN